MAYTQDSKIDSLMIDFVRIINNLSGGEYKGAHVQIYGLFTSARSLEGTEQEYMIQVLYDSALYIESQAIAIRSAAELLDKS